MRFSSVKTFSFVKNTYDDHWIKRSTVRVLFTICLYNTCKQVHFAYPMRKKLQLILDDFSNNMFEKLLGFPFPLWIMADCDALYFS